jgi:hypothetical protein
VVPESIADRAGIGPREKIVAMNDWAFTGQEQCDAALRAAQTAGTTRLLLRFSVPARCR